VPGGILLNKPLSKDEYIKKTSTLFFKGDANAPKLGSKFSFFTDAKGKVHVFQQTFDKEEFDAWATNLGRANDIKHLGTFSDIVSVKDYLHGLKNGKVAMAASLSNLRLGETLSLTASLPDDNYFDEYGGKGGYEKNYKRYGFDLKAILTDYKRNDLLPKTLLEAGCAYGYGVSDFRKSGIKAYGIELNDYAANHTPEEVSRYCKVLDIRCISKFKPGSFQSIFSNALMYLSESEIETFLVDCHKVASQSLYLVNPFSDYPETVPEDPFRETLKPRSWWINTCGRLGWEYCKGTNSLFRKVSNELDYTQAPQRGAPIVL